MSSGPFKFFFWDKEHYKRIEKVLGKKLSDKTRQALEDAHSNFAVNLDIDISRFSHARRLLQKLFKALNNLGELDDLTEQALILADPHTKCPSLDDVKQDLSKLHHRAEIALKKLPPKDRPGPNQKEWPLRTLVAGLEDIYKDTTGKKATLTKTKGSDRSKKEHNVPEGTFFHFVMEFLDIVNHKPHSNVAVMGIIEEVIYHRIPQK